MFYCGLFVLIFLFVLWGSETLKSARINDLFNQCIAQPILGEKALLQEEVVCSFLKG